MIRARIRYLFPAVLIIGVALRVIAFSPFAIHHPDEQIQYIEQAHRLVFGTGVVPWEYRLGMRSWLVPLLLAGPMYLGWAIDPDSLLYVILPRAVVAMLAFAPVPAAYVIGRRISARHGLVAAAVVACWYESIYFSVHVLTESLAMAAFVSAAALLTPGASRNKLLAGGGLLMLAAVFRVHYVPAIAAFAIILVGKRWRDGGWVLLGALPVAIASGAIDAVMGQWPYGWVYANVYQNVIADKASSFGRFGPEAYPEMLWLHWQIALAPILWLAARAARRSPALTAAALVNLAVHLMIGHKEWRFILLSGQIAILLAAIGSVDLVDQLKRSRAGRLPSRSVLLAAMVAIWGATSLMLAFSDLGNPGWRRLEGGFRLAREAEQRHVCGVALVGGSSWAAGGQTYLHDVPLYAMLAPTHAIEDRSFAATSYAYDAVISTSDRPAPAPYVRLDCGGEGTEQLCIAVRPGGCRRNMVSDTHLIQRVMEALGR